MATERGYITQTEYETYSNNNVSDSAEWTRQANIAEAMVDAYVGPHFKFHPDKQVTIASTTSSTFTTSDLDSDKDDFFNGLRVRVVQGTGSGYDGVITDYNSSTDACTVSPAFSSQPTSSSVVVVEQRGVFPRAQDSDVSGRPRVPENVTRAVAAILEFWDTKGGTAGINADAFNSGSAKSSETIGSYSVTYAGSDRDAVELLGEKAVTLLEAYRRRTGAITQGSGVFSRNWLFGR